MPSLGKQRVVSNGRGSLSVFGLTHFVHRMSNTTDIDDAQVEEPEALRTALLDQLGYLIDEIDALQNVVDGLPDQIKNDRPAPDTLTMKEIYGAIATLDVDVRRPRILRIIDETEPTLHSVEIDDEVRDAGWNERPMDDILDQVKDARQALIDALKALSMDDWHQTATVDDASVTIFDLVHKMTQADADRLRDLGYRLHGAHLSDGDEPLPT